jgi:hypothetical protein
VYKRTIHLHNIHKINDSKDESIDYISNLNKYISMVLSVKHEPRVQSVDTNRKAVTVFNLVTELRSRIQSYAIWFLSFFYLYIYPGCFIDKYILFLRIGVYVNNSNLFTPRDR